VPTAYPLSYTNHPRGIVQGSRLPDLTERAILMLHFRSWYVFVSELQNTWQRGQRSPTFESSETGFLQFVHVFPEVMNDHRPKAMVSHYGYKPIGQPTGLTEPSGHP
jgi:hypothetical protein